MLKNLENLQLSQKEKEFCLQFKIMQTVELYLKVLRECNNEKVIDTICVYFKEFLPRSTKSNTEF